MKKENINNSVSDMNKEVAKYTIKDSVFTNLFQEKNTYYSYIKHFTLKIQILQKID